VNGRNFNANGGRQFAHGEDRGDHDQHQPRLKQPVLDEVPVGRRLSCADQVPSEKTLTNNLVKRENAELDRKTKGGIAADTKHWPLT
jgi:hypothetical protein